MKEYLFILLLANVFLIAVFYLFKDRIPLQPWILHASAGVSFILGVSFPYLIANTTLGLALAVYFILVACLGTTLGYLNEKILLSVSYPAASAGLSQQDRVTGPLPAQQAEQAYAPVCVSADYQSLPEFNPGMTDLPAENPFFSSLSTAAGDEPEKIEPIAEDQEKATTPPEQEDIYIMDEPCVEVPSADETLLWSELKEEQEEKPPGHPGTLIEISGLDEKRYDFEEKQLPAKIHKAELPETESQIPAVELPVMDGAGTPKPGKHAVKIAPQSVNELISHGFKAKAAGDPATVLECFIKAIWMSRDSKLLVLLAMEISAAYQELGHHVQAAMFLSTIKENEAIAKNKILSQKIRIRIVYLETLQELLRNANMSNAPYSKIPGLIKTKANLLAADRFK